MLLREIDSTTADPQNDVNSGPFQSNQTSVHLTRAQSEEEENLLDVEYEDDVMHLSACVPFI